MKLGVITFIVVCLTCWTQLTNAQNECEFGDLSSPMIVPDLPDVCSDIRDTPQCCARDFILARLNITEEDFRAALRAELQDRFELFRGIARRVRNFLDSDFLDGLFVSFADLSFLQRRSSVVSEFIRELRDRFDIDRTRDAADNFNVRDLLRRTIDRVKDEVVQEYANLLGSDVQQCIRDLIQGKVDEARMEAFAAAIEQVRRVRTSIDKLADFLDNLNVTLLGYRPLRECVNRLVEVADCDSCVNLRPRMICRNWCGALARACYSPFYETLNEQFTRFWRIVREILQLLPGLWRRLNESRKVLRIGRLDFTAEVLSECSLNLRNNSFLSDLLGKRQADESDRDNTPALPFLPTFDDDSLTGGVIAYGRFGPRLCRDFSIRTAANGRCWDGDRERESDIEPFDEDSISGQDENPAIQIDSSALQAQANALGSPVDTFLADEAFAETAPEGLSGNGSIGLRVTLTLLAAGLLAALGLN